MAAQAIVVPAVLFALCARSVGLVLEAAEWCANEARQQIKLASGVASYWCIIYGEYEERWWGWVRVAVISSSHECRNATMLILTLAVILTIRVFQSL